MRRKFQFSVLVLLLTLGLSVADSTKTAQLAWFYKPPKDGKLDVVARFFDVVILTHADEPTRDKLKTSGLHVPYPSYLRFEAIEDPGSCSASPHRNQVAFHTGDFCKISQSHPDWFLLDRSGRRIEDNNYYVMDPANQGWREFFLSRARECIQEHGWDGIFLDNVEAGIRKRLQKGPPPAKYPDKGSYQAAIEGFLGYLYGNLHQSGNPLWANIIVLDNPEAWFRYMKYLDGAMDENFAVDWNPRYFPPEKWDQQLTMAERTQAEGKHILLVAQGDKDDAARQQFAYASYLLIANKLASFRYSSSDAYGYVWMYDNYSIQLGEPKGKRYQSNGAWRRDFEKGSVFVNPRTHEASIIVGGNSDRRAFAQTGGALRRRVRDQFAVPRGVSARPRETRP